MKAQIIIQLDDDGKLSLASSVKNPFLCLGLLEAAKDAVKQMGQQEESRIEIPKLTVVP